MTLSDIRNSFLSKATTAFSFATVVLANSSPLLQGLGIDRWRLTCLFIGSALFLLGYLVVSFRSPPEFRGGSNLEDLVGHMRKVDHQEYFISRRGMTEALLTRVKRSRVFCPPNGPMIYAQDQISKTANSTEATWRLHAAGLYHVDLALRQYDRPVSRLIAVALMCTGLLLLLVPTIDSVWRAIMAQLAWSP